MSPVPSSSFFADLYKRERKSFRGKAIDFRKNQRIGLARYAKSLSESRAGAEIVSETGDQVGDGQRDESTERQPPSWKYDPAKPNGGRAPHSSREETERRIEIVRQMIVDGHNLGDIKRLQSLTWGVTARTVWQYITLARKRNKQSLRIAGDEACATSIEFWSRRKREAQADAATLREKIAEVERDEAAWLERLHAADDSVIESYTLELSRLSKKVDSLARRLQSAESREAKAHDRIDVILGTRAPTKVAITDAAGNDLPRDPQVLQTRLVALGFALPALPDGTGGAVQSLPALPPATRLEASARRLDSRE